MVPLQVTQGRSGGEPVPPNWTPGATPGRKLDASWPPMPSKLGTDPCLHTPVGCCWLGGLRLVSSLAGVFAFCSRSSATGAAAAAPAAGAEVLGAGNGSSPSAANALPTEPSRLSATASDFEREIPNWGASGDPFATGATDAERSLLNAPLPIEFAFTSDCDDGSGALRVLFTPASGRVG